MRSKYSFFYHTAYWLFYILFFTIQRYSLYGYNDFFPNLLLNFIYIPNVIIFTYLISEFLIPALFSQNSKFIPVLLLISILFIEPAFAYLLRETIVEPFIFSDHTPYTLFNYLSAILIFVFGVTPIAGFKIANLQKQAYRHQSDTEQAKLEAELKLREAELKLLRMQLHPHFLFNTLNNLYSLSICKSDKTPEIIIKISDLLNYIIYECRSDKVSLEKEIEFIKSYIDLEKIRFDDNLQIKLCMEGNFNGKYIAPMILHTFVENSFKHGASKISNNSWITIDLELHENMLHFNISNNSQQNKTKTSPGIGIENAKKRLALLYPQKHSISISEKENSFNVCLTMEL